MMGSGTFHQPRSTVTRNCPVSFDKTCGLRAVSRGRYRPYDMKEWVFPPSGSLIRAQARLLACPRAPQRSQCCRVGRSTTGCWSKNQISSLASGISICAWESSLRLLEPAGSPGLQSMSYWYGKVLGSSCNAIAYYVRFVIINYWQSAQRLDCDISVLRFFYKRKNSF